MRKKALIGCEYSGIVRDAFIRAGHDAISCDLLPTERPGPHIQGDIRKVLGGGQYDMLIVFPPCTFICSSGLHWNKRRPERAVQTEEALQFVADLMNAPVPLKSLENPIGCISTRIVKMEHEVIPGYSGPTAEGTKYRVLPVSTKSGLAPSQIIQPWQFGHAESKATCLWLQGLPILQSTKIADFENYRCRCGNVFPESLGKYGCCDGPAKPLWNNQTASGQNKIGPSADRWKERSKTYEGIAEAMASQWGKYLL